MGLPINIKTIDAVSALIINDKKQVLLLKRNELSYHGYWQFPEGKIDKGETKLQAIKRELYEEIGSRELKIKKLSVRSSPFMFKGLSVTIEREVYRASAPKEIVLSDEHTEYGWFSYSESKRLQTVPGVIEIIKEYLA